MTNPIVRPSAKAVLVSSASNMGMLSKLLVKGIAAAASRKT
jgi:hypothetical protein